MLIYIEFSDGTPMVFKVFKRGSHRRCQNIANRFKDSTDHGYISTDTCVSRLFLLVETAFYSRKQAHTKTTLKPHISCQPTTLLHATNKGQHLFIGQGTTCPNDFFKGSPYIWGHCSSISGKKNSKVSDSPQGAGRKILTRKYKCDRSWLQSTPTLCLCALSVYLAHTLFAPGKYVRQGGHRGVYRTCSRENATMSSLRRLSSTALTNSSRYKKSC